MNQFIKFFLFRLVPLLIVAIAALAAFIKLQYGRGYLYPDIGAGTADGVGRLEKLIKLDYPPGNIAVASNGHVYFNYHPLARPARFSPATVFEWVDGEIKPFPSMEMQKSFQGTFGMTIDKQNRIWFIEPASFDFPHTRLWAFDLATRKKSAFFEFPGHEAQFAQDLRVTADGKYILLADPGIFTFTSPKVIVYSIEDHSFRTAIRDASCILPEDWVIQTPYGLHRMLGGILNFSVGLDGIEISADQNWVYLGPMTSEHLCRVPLADVLDTKLTPAEVAEKVEDIGQKPLSDGITVDKAGNVIITDVEHGGLMEFDLATKKVKTLVRSKDIMWADGVVTGPDGSLYFTDSSIPSYITATAGAPEKSVLVAHRPYYVYRLKH